MPNILPALSDTFYIPHYCLSVIDPDAITDRYLMQTMVTDVSTPEFNRNFDTDARSAMPGIVPLPLNWGEMELSFTLQSFSQPVLEILMSGMNRLLTLELNGCGLSHDGNSNVDVTIISKGFLQNGFGFSFPAQASASSEYSMMLQYYSMVITRGVNITTLIYDPKNFILSVNGTNLLADIGQCLGIIS